MWGVWHNRPGHHLGQQERPPQGHHQYWRSFSWWLSSPVWRVEQHHHPFRDLQEQVRYSKASLYFNIDWFQKFGTGSYNPNQANEKKTYYFCYPRCLQECPPDDVHSYFLCADNGRNGKALHHQLLQLHNGRHWQVPVTMLFWNSVSDSGPFFPDPVQNW